MLGKCKLCHRDQVELQKSHYQPAGVYRIIRGPAGPGVKPEPFNVVGGRSVQTSYQPWAYLLCRECEQRFTRNGETWFFRNTLRNDGTFRLLDTFRAGTPVVHAPGNDTMIFAASDFPSIAVEKLIYFATSVFWRGSIHPWNQNGTIPVNLRGYADQFRRYLLGERGFPERAALWAVVRQPSVVSGVTYTPLGGSKGKTSTYRYPLPGFTFMLMFEPQLSGRMRRYCFVRAERHPLILTDTTDELLFHEARKAIASNARDDLLFSSLA